MPVILTKPDEIEMWMSAPAPEAVKLQRALSDDALRVVARGQKEDGPQVTWFVPPLRVRLDRQPASRRGAFAGFASASAFPPAIGGSISRGPSTSGGSLPCYIWGRSSRQRTQCVPRS